jgi:hypothetical protein
LRRFNLLRDRRLGEVLERQLAVFIPLCRSVSARSKTNMAIRDFFAHVTKKLPTEVKFTTRNGEKVQFTAEKPMRVKTHVHFKTCGRKRG